MPNNTIAVIFDFDDTLAPDSTSSFLETIGVDAPKFWAETVNPLLKEGWDPIPAYLHSMIELSKTSPEDKRITQESLVSYGKEIEFFNGVENIFQAIREQAQEKNPRVSVEFYIISSGIREILLNTKIAKEFTEIWACDFLYNEKGEIAFPKKIISFTDKTRYLFHVGKGLIGKDDYNDAFAVNKRVPQEHLRIPMDQMIFVGDGSTDIPCFSLLKKQRGITIGVYDPEEKERWGRAWGFIQQDRVSNLVQADFREQFDLYKTLLMAVGGIATNIDLKERLYSG